jgi:hypothetical protein
LASTETLTGAGREPVVPSNVDLEDPLRSFAPEPLDDHLTTHHVAPASDVGEAAERFVYDIYRVSEFCQESPRGWVEETEPWREGSTLHVVMEGDDVLGVVRTILGTYDELPIGQFGPDQPPPDGTLCEVASLAVKPDRRGLGVANELHRMTFEFGIRSAANGFCFLVDEWMAQFFQDYYAFPVRQMAPVQPYMGGDIMPIMVRVDELLEVFPRRRPLVYQRAISGFSPAEVASFDLPIVLP